MLLTVVIFILILSLLIFVHELGHFLTAKRSGVRVEEFGFGFPPRLWGKKIGETVYSLNWIPLGGFVKLKGESGEAREDQDSFAHQGFLKRSLILSAGVLMNVALAVFLFSVGYLFGLPTALTDEQMAGDNVRDVKIQIAGVVKDSAAEQAGLKPGDQLLAIDQVNLKNVGQLQLYLKEHAEQSMSLAVKREQEVKTINFQPGIIPGYSQSKVLGTTLIQSGIVRYGLVASWYQGAVLSFNVLKQIVISFYQLFKNLLIGLGLTVELSGPVGVAVMTGKAVSLGWLYLLQFTAILSLNLAVVNFLPFPALDGGRFLFLIIEKIRRRPNNQKIENIIHNLGFSLLMILVLIVTYRDVVRYGPGLVERIKNLF